MTLMPNRVALTGLRPPVRPHHPACGSAPGRCQPIAGSGLGVRVVAPLNLGIVP